MNYRTYILKRRREAVRFPFRIDERIKKLRNTFEIPLATR